MNATLSHRHPSRGRSSDQRAAVDDRVPAWQIWAVCGLLVLAVGLVFGQTAGHEFINLDDGDFVSQNPHVTPGLTLAGLRWAFTDGAYGEWTPLTSLSHMLDCQLYGLEPAGHHLTSVLIHAASAVLLFLVLLRMTAQRAVPTAAQASGVMAATAGPSATNADVWPSAWVAAVFAIHPLHVSSVAWVAERREVLAGLFFMLTLGAYVLYVERPSLARYLAVAGLLMLGLMAKVILVTVPCVLLLLDYWPLGRFRDEDRPDPAGSWFGRLPRAWRLVAEKIPLLAISGLNCLIVLATHNSFRWQDRVESVSLPARLGNALVSYAAYLGQSFCPINLSPYYPHPGNHLPWIWPACSLLLLLAISVVAALTWRRMPYLAVGWLWFLGMTVPVLGLVGTFVQGRADNYTYLSQIGLSIAVAWGLLALVRPRQATVAPTWRPAMLAAAAGAVVLVLTAVSWQQTRYWHTSKTVWMRAASATSGNLLALHFLAHLYYYEERIDEAIELEREALKYDSIARYLVAAAHDCLGNCLMRRGERAEAMPHYTEAVRIAPYTSMFHSDLAVALAQTGNLDRAITEFREAARLEGDAWPNRVNLANVLFANGQPREAAQVCREVLQRDPQSAPAAALLQAILAVDPELREPAGSDRLESHGP